MKIERITSVNSFLFGKGVHQSICKFLTRFTLPNNSHMEFTSSVIPIDVSFLIGLQIVMEYNITLDWNNEAQEQHKQQSKMKR